MTKRIVSSKTPYFAIWKNGVKGTAKKISKIKMILSTCGKAIVSKSKASAVVGQGKVPGIIRLVRACPER